MHRLDSPEFAAMREKHPDWDNLQILRRMEDLKRLREINEQRRRKQLDDCLKFWSEEQ